MAIRKIELARAAWGTSLLLVPRWTLEKFHRIEVDATSLLVARVLGARQLAQAVLSGVHPSPEVLAMGIWVDVAHAASALGLAAVDQDRASAGLTDAAVAGAWAAAGWHDLQSSPVTRPAHDRGRDRSARWVLARVPGGAPLRSRVLKRRARNGERVELRR